MALVDGMKISGWIILQEEDLKPIEFITVYPDDPNTEAPYSNDSGILQFFITLTTTKKGGKYPHLDIQVTQPTEVE